MKLIAHRGWSRGPDENSLAALRRSANRADVSGVELDVRRSGRGTLILSHDEPPRGAEPPTLHEAARFLAGTKLDLLLELKEPGIHAEVIRILRSPSWLREPLSSASPTLPVRWTGGARGQSSSASSRHIRGR